MKTNDFDLVSIIKNNEDNKEKAMECARTELEKRGSTTEDIVLIQHILESYYNYRTARYSIEGNIFKRQTVSNFS